MANTVPDAIKVKVLRQLLEVMDSAADPGRRLVDGKRGRAIAQSRGAKSSVALNAARTIKPRR